MTGGGGAAADPAMWVERAAQDERLRRFLRPPENAAGRAPGEPRVLLVEGPPGFGAGTLLGSAPRIARASGWAVLELRPVDTADGPSLLPAVERIAEGGLPALPRGLAERARHAPTVLTVPDLQRVPERERQAVELAVRRNLRLPLLAVLRRWPGPRVPEPFARRLRPGPLSVDAVHAMLGGSRARAEQLHALAHGVPAIIAAVARELGDRGEPSAEHLESCIRRARERFEATVISALPRESARLAVGLAVTAGALPLDAAGALVGLGDLAACAALEVLSSIRLCVPGQPRLREPALAHRVLYELPARLPELPPLAELVQRAAELAYRRGAPDRSVADILALEPGTRAAWTGPVLHRAALDGGQHGPRAAGIPGLTARDRDDLRLREAIHPVAGRPARAARELAGLVSCGADAAIRVRAAEQLVLRCATRISRVTVGHAAVRSRIGAEERGCMQALYWLVRNLEHESPALEEPAVERLPEAPADPSRAGVLAKLVAGRGGRGALARARTLARRGLEPGGAVLPRIAACQALVIAEELDEAGAALTALTANMDGTGAPAVRATALFTATSLEVRRGRLFSAHRALAEARRALPGRFLPRHAAGLRFALPAHVALAGGDIAGAGRWLDGAPRNGLGSSGDRLEFTRGCHALASGTWLDAAAAFRRSGHGFAARGCLNPSLVPWRSYAALGLATAGELDAARELAGREAELARDWSAPGALGWALVVRALVLGPGGEAELEEGIALLRGSPLRSRLPLAMTTAAYLARSDLLATLREATGPYEHSAVAAERLSGVGA
ncbi:hypothetical protein [Sciscionella sediminilitoris]|uniref:hypothetical protein n=1 Tax=Sciscionella sediminilitoris TaxID=1445613 RepID=UPI0004DF9CD9|nr:hypothetical protein [Sciscionella sp. SE31]